MASQCKIISRNSFLVAFKRQEKWCAILYSFGTPLAICNPFDKSIYVLADLRFKTATQHLLKWMENIRQSGSIPEILECQSKKVSEDELDAKIDEFLRLV